MRLLALVLVLLSTAISRGATQVFADEDGGDGKLTFCHFGPKMKVLAPEEGNTAKDPCAATAKIQGVQWECAPPDQVRRLVAKFRSSLADQAADECEKHCRLRGSSCKGVLVRPTRCGLETDRDDAVAMGKRQGCREDCSGASFIYCSLYDAGFRTEDPERLAKQAPNCHCMSEN